MLINHLTSDILSRIKEKPTLSQERLAETLAAFTMHQKDDTLLIVRGYAGTGKTTEISAYVKMLKEMSLKSVLMAPTGRAAKILTSYSGEQAYTIHKKIYRQRSSKDGFGRFVLDHNLHTNTVFIVDEASMISNQKQEGSIFGSGCLLDDLIEYVYNGKGCKLILVGDTAQLPPVGLDISPALNKNIVMLYSDNILEDELQEVVRQTKESGILHNASVIRKRIAKQDFSLPILQIGDFEDIVRIGGHDLIEMIAMSYDKYGLEETIVVSRSNKRSNQYNIGIRNSILGRDEELKAGDLLMVVKNNYFWLKDDSKIDFIANGDIIEVLRIYNYQELYGYRFADCCVRLIDFGIEANVKLILNVLYEDGPALSGEKNKELFYKILEDYTELKSKKKKYESVRNNEHFNAIQVKYAYAVTCHKSQGGQWKSVFIDQGYIEKENITIEYFRWLYTALTRATEKIYLVNFPDYFFE